MAKLSVDGSFVRYELTDQEKALGQELSLETTMVLQNLIADAAEDKIRLAYDPTNPTKFAQDEALLRGQIEILQYVLQLSKSAADLRNANV